MEPRIPLRVGDVNLSRIDSPDLSRVPTFLTASMSRTYKGKPTGPALSMSRPGLGWKSVA